jgi:choline dehydrogenase-like flavoprotein
MSTTASPEGAFEREREREREREHSGQRSPEEILKDTWSDPTGWRGFLAQRCREIMEAMGPSRLDFTTELTPYKVYEYQSTHNTGGAIMGRDPGDSVTNKYGQVWDTPNVFVTGATLYPQNPGLNPTGTLLALAYHTADGIISRYLRDPGRVMG